VGTVRCTRVSISGLSLYGVYVLTLELTIEVYFCFLAVILGTMFVIAHTALALVERLIKRGKGYYNCRYNLPNSRVDAT
jgi:hypothetical protein